MNWILCIFHFCAFYFFGRADGSSLLRGSCNRKKQKKNTWRRIIISTPARLRSFNKWTPGRPPCGANGPAWERTWPRGAFGVSASAAAYEQIHSKFTANAYLLVDATVGVKFNFCIRKHWYSLARAEIFCTFHEVGGKLASTVWSLLIFYFILWLLFIYDLSLYWPIKGKDS